MSDSEGTMHFRKPFTILTVYFIPDYFINCISDIVHPPDPFHLIFGFQLLAYTLLQGTFSD